MPVKSWSASSEARLTLLKGEGLPNAEIVNRLQKEFPGEKFSVPKVKSKLQRMRTTVVIPKPEVREPTVDEHVAVHKARANASGLEKLNKTLVAEVARLKEELAAFLRLSSYQGDYKITARKSGHRVTTAFILAGDWHSEEEVVPEVVNGVNEFTLAIAEQRIEFFWQNAIRILERKASYSDIENVVLVLGGDFISNDIHEELLETCQLEPMDAIEWVQERIAAGLRLLEASCKKLKLPLTVVCKVGNHSRTTKKVRSSTEAGHALEWLMYGTLAQLFPRLTWIRERSYHTYLDVYGFQIRIHHGHKVRYNGGSGGLTIPLNKAIAAWNRTRNAHLDIVFHWHQLLNTGKAIVNGSLIGFSPFCVDIKAEFEPPRQKFFLFTNKGEVTGEEIIFLE